MRKYRNTKIKTENGEIFDSKKEYHRYIQLRAMQANGRIYHLQRQVKRVLIPAQKGEQRNERSVTYTSDFEYDQAKTGKHIVEDTKSEITRKDKAYIIKRKLMLERYGISIVEV